MYRAGIAVNTPVMVNWHAQRCELTRVRAQWLVSGKILGNQKWKKRGILHNFQVDRLNRSRDTAIHKINF